jgi:hypothetical protein
MHDTFFSLSSSVILLNYFEQGFVRSFLVFAELPNSVINLGLVRDESIQSRGCINNHLSLGRLDVASNCNFHYWEIEVAFARNPSPEWCC